MLTFVYFEECPMITSRRAWQVAMVVALGGLATFSTVRAADSKYLPNDTEIVFTINLKQILDSDLVKANKDALNQAKAQLENQAGDNPALKYLKAAGFDIFRDLHSITMASNGSKDPTAILIDGTFNTAKFNATAEEVAKDSPDTIKITKVGVRTVFEITPPGEKMGFACLIDGKVLLATSSKEALTNALAQASGSKKSELKKEFAVLLDTVNNKQSINFVATGPALAKLVESAPIPNGEAASAALQNIDGLSGAITVNKDVQFQLGINAKDEPGAKKMASDGSGMLLVVQVLVGQQAKKDEKFAPLVDVVKTLRITSQGSNVLLRGTVSIDVIEKLMKNIPQ
jgi:hypothetical protein